MSLKIGDKISWLPVSPREKFIVSCFGNTDWIVENLTQTCLAFGGQAGILIKPTNGNHIRWIREGQILKE